MSAPMLRRCLGSFGFAQLETYQSRTELIGWCDAEAEWPAGKKPGLAVMLREPFPMEFPQKGAELFRELEKQHVSRKMIVGLLAMAADLVDDDEPIHLIVGLPMRRAMDGTPRTHIAVWTTPPAFAKGLKLTLSKENDNEEMTELRSDIGDIVYTMLAETNISWCRGLRLLLGRLRSGLGRSIKGAEDEFLDGELAGGGLGDDSPVDVVR